MSTFKDITAGYYWARWHTCDPGTEDYDIFEPRKHYEPVEVTQNTRAANHPQHLRVFVLGFAGSQDVRNFEFGDRIGDWKTFKKGNKHDRRTKD